MEKNTEEIILKNVKEKFANAKKQCPGMSNDMYVLTDYISSVVNDSLEPIGLILTLLGVMDDLEKGKKWI